MEVGLAIWHGPNAALVYHEDEPLVDHEIPLVLDGFELEIGALKFWFDRHGDQDLYRCVNE